MADWTVKPDHQWESEWRQKLGDAEFERRLAVADAKADELLSGSNGHADAVPREEDGDVHLVDKVSDAAFAEATFMRGQFRSMVMQISSADLVTKAAVAPGRRWANLVYKLAGS